MTLEIDLQDVRRALLAYIGNTLSSQEREEFDRLVLGNESFSQQVEEAEFSLTEDYADGTLPAEERAVVEDWISESAGRRGQVAIETALRERGRRRGAERASKTPRSFKSGFSAVWFWGFAATASILAIFALSLPHHMKPAAPVVAELSQPRLAPARPAAEDTILLQARRLRGSGTNSTISTYTLHTGMATRIQIVVPHTSASGTYSVDLHQDASGGTRVPIHLTQLRVEQTNSLRYVTFSLPPGTLLPGAYVGDIHSSEESYRLHFSIAYIKN